MLLLSAKYRQFVRWFLGLNKELRLIVEILYFKSVGTPKNGPKALKGDLLFVVKNRIVC